MVSHIRTRINNLNPLKCLFFLTIYLQQSMLVLQVLAAMVVSALTQWETTFVSARSKVLCTILENAVMKVHNLLKNHLISNCLCVIYRDNCIWFMYAFTDAVANAPSAPAIINNPKNQKNELNSPVSLTCEAVGSPMPVIQWFKDGVQLRGSGAVGNKYIIPELGAADRGSYHCEASNGFRDPVKSSEATVIVTGN